MKLSTVLSAPLLSAAVLAGPVADPTNTPVPADTTDPNPEGLPNLVALFFTLLGAPPCSIGCLNREIANTPSCTGILNIACFCDPATNFVTRVFMCAATDACSAADVTRLTAAIQLGCGLVGSPIGGDDGGVLGTPPPAIPAENL